MGYGPTLPGNWARATACAALLVSSVTVQALPPDNGQSIAFNGTKAGVAACVACHGMQGAGDAIGGFPRIAGLSAPYIEAQLTAYANGHRSSFLMETPARLLTPEERTAVSTYFSQLPSYVPATPIALDETAKPIDVGAWLATRGRWNQGLPACAQCHGATGLGVGTTFPPLTGQGASYIALQLHHWRDGKRPPGPMNLMSLIAGKLSDTDITAVAAYYGGPDAEIQKPRQGEQK